MLSTGGAGRAGRTRSPCGRNRASERTDPRRWEDAGRGSGRSGAVQDGTLAAGEAGAALAVLRVRRAVGRLASGSR